MKTFVLILKIATAVFAVAGLLGFALGGSISLVTLGVLNLLYGVYAFKNSKYDAWSSIAVGLFSIMVGFISA